VKELLEPTWSSNFFSDPKKKKLGPGEDCVVCIIFNVWVADQIRHSLEDNDPYQLERQRSRDDTTSARDALQGTPARACPSGGKLAVPVITKGSTLSSNNRKAA
jgi:hypothetical protein